MLGSVLFVTTLAWMGAAAFTGATAPMGNAALKYAYAVLLVFPIAFAVTGLQPLSQPVLVMLFWAWMVLAGLVGALAPHDISVKTYIPLVIAPLFIGIGVLMFYPPIVSLPRPDWEGWDSIEFALIIGSYGLAAFLLYRAFLARLAWIHRLRSNLLFIPVAVSTVAFTILTVRFVVLWHNDSLALALFGLVITLGFGAAQLKVAWSEQCEERELHGFRVSIAALGVAMASYWVVIPVALAGTAFLRGGSPFAVIFLIPVIGAAVIAVPAGHLIGKTRYPYRNILVAAIGPGLLMMMMMSFYWFHILDKGL